MVCGNTLFKYFIEMLTVLKDGHFFPYRKRHTLTARLFDNPRHVEWIY